MEELEQGEAVEETTEEDAELSGSSTEETEEETAEDASAGQPKTSVQKRIGQLTRKQREAERERDYWRQVAMQNQQPAQQQAPAQPQVDSRPQRPTLEQFEYDDGAYNRALDEYEDKLTDWKFRQNWAKQQEAQKKNQEKEAQSRRVTTFNQKLDSLYEKGESKFEDFADIVSPTPMSVDTAEALFETDNAEAIAYYLGKNPEEAVRIDNMTPYQKGIALGKLDVKFSGTTKKTTNAPPPPSKLTGSHVSTVDINDMPFDQYKKLRNEGKL